MTTPTPPKPIEADIIAAAEQVLIDMMIPSTPTNYAAIAAAIQAERDKSRWLPIRDYKITPQQVMCGHDEKKWMRFGRYEPTVNRWYYSGTNERSQWAQVEGDVPTHFQDLPSPPKEGE